jgi:hypothetical protein
MLVADHLTQEHLFGFGRVNGSDFQVYGSTRPDPGVSGFGFNVIEAWSTTAPGPARASVMYVIKLLSDDCIK